MASRGETTRPHLTRTTLNLTQWGLELITWKVATQNPPILLIPGHFCPRQFWLPTHRNGFADALATLGFQPFVLAPTTKRTYRLSRKTSDWAFRIVPSALNFIAEQSGMSPHALGYSAGGAYLLAAQALLTSPAPCRSMCLIGTQLESAQPNETRFAQGLLGTLGRLSIQLNGSWLGYPQSHNTAAELSEYVDAKAQSATKGPLAALMKPNPLEIVTPLLSLSSDADTVAPPHGCRELFQRINAPIKNFEILRSKDEDHPIHHHSYFSSRHQAGLLERLNAWMSAAR